MKLKKGADLVQFIRAVRRCRGDVLFTTAEGDSLNLKSVLSQYLFSAVSGQTDLIVNGEIQLHDMEDSAKLEAFVE